MDLSLNGLIIELAYVVAAALFIFGLKLLGSAATARKGNTMSSVGMLIAIVAALIDQGIVEYQWIIAGVLVGGLIGAVAARMVQMTSMPEMVALFNGFGGLASLLVGWAALNADAGAFTVVTIVLSVLIGGVTFTGSLIAYGKLSESIGSGAILFRAADCEFFTGARDRWVCCHACSGACEFAVVVPRDWFIAAVWNYGSDSNWRCRYAGCYFLVELLLGSGCLCRRLRNQ